MAFFHDNRPSREPFLTAPSSVLWLLVVILAAHLARVYAPDPWPETILVNYSFVPVRYAAGLLAANGIAPASLVEQILPFVSYNFLHADFTHVGINCLWLLAFAAPVARRFGTPIFLLFFLFCGTVAAAVHLAANWGSFVPVVGASGSIAGLMAVAVRLLYGRHYTYAGEAPRLAPIFSRHVLFFTAIWVAINVAAVFTGGLMLGAPASSSGEPFLVAWQAHLGGYFAGLLFADIFDVLSSRRRTDRFVN